MRNRRTSRSAPSAAPSTRAEAKEASRRRVLDAARALFAERGFERTTVRDVAARAGVAAGSVTFHAGNKETMLQVVFREDLERVFARAFVRAGRHPRPADRLVTVFDALLVHVVRHRPVARTLVLGLLSPRPELPRLGFRARLASLLEGARLREGVTPLRVATLAFGLHLATVVAMLGDEGMTLPRARANVREAIDLLFRGVAPEGDASPVSPSRPPSRPPSRMPRSRRSPIKEPPR